MITICIVGTIFASIGLFTIDDRNSEKRNTIARFLMYGGVILAIFGTFASIIISDVRTSNQYITCTPNSLALQRDCILSDGTSFYKPKQSLLAREFWIPGSLVEMEPCDAPEDFCVDCMEIQMGNYCSSCGRALKNLYPDCGTACDTPCY